MKKILLFLVFTEALHEGWNLSIQIQEEYAMIDSEYNPFIMKNIEVNVK